MTRRRSAIIGFAAVVVLLALGAALMLNSGVQTWAARRYLSQQPDYKGNIGRLDAGFQRVHAENVEITRDGAKLTVPVLDLEMPLIAAARNRVAIKRLVAKGWILDLTAFGTSRGQAASGTGSATPNIAAPSTVPSSSPVDANVPVPPFRGIFEMLRLPADLSVDVVELDGEIVIPAATAGQVPIRVRITAAGGALSAGKEGKLTISAQGDLGADSRVREIKADGAITAVMQDARTFSRLALRLDAHARGPQTSDGAALTLVATAVRATAGERYTIELGSNDRRMLVASADYPIGAGGPSTVSGTWSLDITDTDVAPFALGRALPEFAASGGGKIVGNAALDEFSGTGRLTAKANKLGAVRPEFAAMGPLEISADFDLLQDGAAIHLGGLIVDVAGDSPVASVKALQAFEFNARTGELKVEDRDRDLLKVELQALPVAWLQPLVEGFAVSGGGINGDFVVRAHDGGFRLRSLSPLHVSKVSVNRGANPLVSSLELSAMLGADYTPQGWQAEVTEFSARHDASTVLELTGRVGQLAGKESPLKAAAQWSASVPRLLKQPIAGGKDDLVDGRASGDLAVSLGRTKEIQAKFEATGLKLRAPTEAADLPNLRAEIRASVDEHGKIALNAPLTVEYSGRKSDLNLTGTILPATEGFAIDAKVASGTIFFDDLKALTTLARAPAVGSAGAPSAGADTRPFWDGVTGQIALAAKRMVYQRQFEVSDIAGNLRIERGAIRLETLRAGLGGESTLKLSGGVTFDEKATEAYGLELDFGLKQFDPGPVLRAINPGRPPSLEGRFDVASKVSGRAPALGRLAAIPATSIEISSKGGIFRGLAVVLPGRPATQSTIAYVGSVIGSAFDPKSPSSSVMTTLVEITKSLSEIQFDQLTVTAERGTQQRIVLTGFNLISPDARISGDGEIDFAPGVPFLQRKLEMTFTVGARGQLGDLMNQAKLLKPEKDNLGYVTLSVPARIGGSMSKTDPAEFQRRLIDVAVERNGLGDKAYEIWNRIFK